MWFIRLKNGIKTVVAVFCALLLFAFAQVLRMGRFSDVEGEHTFYLQSPSSQAVAKERLFLWEVFSVQGESVRFACTDREKTLEDILHKYEAAVCFVESAGGSISYYCQTTKWTGGVYVNGDLINLQVAFNGNTCAIGSPIIFGGF